jgi:hypothetical protein
MRKIYVICFAKRNENHAKRFVFRFHFAWSEKKIKRKKDTLYQTEVRQVHLQLPTKGLIIDMTRLGLQVFYL